MTLSTLARSITAASILGVLPLGAAQAGSIATPVLFKGAGNQIICIANNITNQTLNVTVKIIGVLGNDTQTCSLDPNDGGGCQAFRNNDAGYCVISMTGLTNAQVAVRLRGVLISRRTTSPFTTDAVVQAQ
ncbi:MAG TPA: hypothetical protein VHD14_16220 [Pseudolabrys sp.]|jgi:hypothetical protein|nr:hypothetical protein [Pseudolabrys sp.]